MTSMMMTTIRIMTTTTGWQSYSNDADDAEKVTHLPPPPLPPMFTEGRGPFFQQAISQSGSALATWAMSYDPMWCTEKLAVSVNCSNHQGDRDGDGGGGGVMLVVVVVVVVLLLMMMMTASTTTATTLMLMTRIRIISHSTFMMGIVIVMMATLALLLLPLLLLLIG